MSRSQEFKVLFLLYVGSCTMAQEEVVRLPNELSINPNHMTLSGFSSGGTFAQHMYLSYSSMFRGLAIFSHTYYRCGPIDPSQEVYDLACTQLGNESTFYNFDNVFTDINNYVANGLIEDPRTLRNKPLYVWMGTRNWLLRADMSLKLLQLYEPYIQNPHVIRTVVQDGNLTLPTNNPNHPPCSGPTNPLLVNNCGRSGAFEALQWLLGTTAVVQPQPNVQLEPLLSFDQTEFFYGIDSQPLMNDVGYFYIPRVCRQGGNGVHCHVHFYFHGCFVTREFVGPRHIQESGFLEVAETNGIIMVFPQTRTSTFDELGCWDTHGITGALYATRRGTQVTVVRNMLSRLLREDGQSVPLPSPRPHTPLQSQLRNVFGVGGFSTGTSQQSSLAPQSHHRFFHDRETRAKSYRG